MTELRQRIKHIIYIVKENRTYDQILGDLAMAARTVFRWCWIRPRKSCVSPSLRESR